MAVYYETGLKIPGEVLLKADGKTPTALDDAIDEARTRGSATIIPEGAHKVFEVSGSPVYVYALSNTLALLVQESLKEGQVYDEHKIFPGKIGVIGPGIRRRSEANVQPDVNEIHTIIYIEDDSNGNDVGLKSPATPTAA